MYLILNKIDELLVKIFPQHALRQFIKFAIAGVICMILELTLYSTQIYVFKIDPVYANPPSVIAALLLNYLISRAWVFETGRYQTSTEFMAFAVVGTIAFLLNQGIVWLMVDYLFVHPITSKLVAIATVVIWNFFAKKFFVFKG
jgi:putative flippase GtrA